MCGSRVSVAFWMSLLVGVLLVISPTVSRAQNSCIVNGWDGQWQMVYTPISSTSATDSVSAGANLLGQRSWGFEMFSWNCETFNNPSITFPAFSNSRLYNPDFWQDGKFPSDLTAPTLPSGGPQYRLSGGFTLSPGAPTELLYFTPGFDSSQTVSPLVIPANATGVIQTVTVKVTPRHERYFTSGANPPSGIQLRFDGKIVSAVTVTPEPEPGQFSGAGSSWSLNGPQLDTQYTFTVNISVDNPNSYPIVSKPGLMAMMMVFGASGPYPQQSGTSITLYDQELDGNIVYSLDESVNWNPGLQKNFQVNYAPVTAQATFTADGLCSLVRQYTSQHGIANSLCVKLDNASDAKARGDVNAEAGLLGAFANEVSAQTGKAFTAEQAQTLIGLLGYFQ
jgi:hypothetical protein